MASTTRRALKTIQDHGGDEIADSLYDAIASLRSEVASITRAVNSYGGNSFGGLQHGASALAQEVQHQFPIVARQASRQMTAVGKAVRNDPVPTLAILATVTLISTLLFRKN